MSCTPPHAMKRFATLLIVSLLIVAGESMPARAEGTVPGGATPDFPAVATQPDEFAKGWTLLEKAEGDLNGDGRSDVALVLEDPNEPNSDDAPPRYLLVALRGADGRLQRALVSQRAILRRDEGGTFGDPLADIAISHGELVIDHYGGSAWRWGSTDRFALRQGEWRQVGHNETHHFTGDQSFITRDTDLVTGRVTVKRDRGEEGAVTPYSDTHTFQELAVPPVEHRPALGDEAGWPLPPRRMKVGATTVDLQAAVWRSQLLLRAVLPRGAAKLLLKDAGGTSLSPAEQEPRRGIQVWVLPLKRLRIEPDPKRQPIGQLPQLRLSFKSTPHAVPLSVRLQANARQGTLETFAPFD